MFKIQKRRTHRPDGSNWSPAGDWFDLTGLPRGAVEADSILEALETFNAALLGGAEYRKCALHPQGVVAK